MAAEQPQSSLGRTLSAIVVCFNEEQNIGACLESLSWCDEIVVVDSFSTDRTVEIARQYTDRIIQRPWPGYREQKAFAHSQATLEWVLLVDADEQVTPELRNEIRQAIAQDNGRYAGYLVPRLVYYLGRWWRCGSWYPDYTLRLFRRDKATWGGLNPHEKVLVQGEVRHLANPLYHFSYRNIDDQIARINRYTTIASEELRRQGKSWRWIDALFRPPLHFVKSYILKRGFKEGFAGFYLAASGAVYVFFKYAKLWEIELAEKEKVERERSQPPAEDLAHRS